ncbi:MAG: hypothetical protein J6B45_00410 [Clostridia bacterium]|nr:hypothetical protein [Clostridia bacterium]
MKKQKVNNLKKPKKKSAFKKALNKFMPYILSIFAAIMLFGLTGLAGGFGVGVRNLLYGIFSNFATYFFPIFLIYHAIMWNYDVKRRICVRRVVCSIVTLICFSTMQYLIQVGDYEALNSYSVSAFFNLGKASVGGGFVGGFFGKLLLGLGNILGVIIITLILVLMILQMFNITPAYMVRSMLKNKKPKAKAKKVQPVKNKAEKRIKPTNPKRIEVFDDEDSVELDPPPAFLDTTKVVSMDNGDTLSNSYEDLSIDKMHERTEHIPSQLQPYNRNEKYVNLKETKEFTVSTSKYEEHKEADTAKASFSGYESHYKNEAFDEEEEDLQEFEELPFDDEETEEVPVNSSYDFEEDDYSDAYEDEEECVPFEAFEKFDEEFDEEADEEGYISEEILNKVTTKEDEKKLRVVSTPVFEKAVKEEKTVEKTVEKKEKKKINYTLPPIYFLKSQPDNSNSDEVRAELQENAKKIVETLNDFKAPTRIVDVTRGPTITRYELQPEKGVRVSKIEGLVDDIALSLAAHGIRIECPIPGKNAIGIEVPNKTISFVYLRDLIEDPRFDKAKSKLTCALGKSIAGENIYVDIENTPHLLVAGATGMGKSVCINSLLISLLYKAKPDEVRLILIDPKRVELSNYNGIPHLLVPVVCEPKKALGALQWAVTEMEERFEAIQEAGVRKIEEFNQKVENGYDAEKMPRIVIVIDELADLKMAVPDIDGHITRLTQKARAAGIHIIIGTQRPSVDVLTGLIKNNIPSRIAFRVPSQIDSRTILDEIGADKLVAKGDMLVKIVGALSLVRVQGAYVSVEEIQDVIDYWKESGPDNYDEEVVQKIENNAAKLAKNDKDIGESDDEDGDELDPMFYKALNEAVKAGKISSSYLQRKLSLGFGRASRIIDQMESLGYVGEQNGTKPRDVLITQADYQEIMMRRNDE